MHIFTMLMKALMLTALLMLTFNRQKDCSINTYRAGRKLAATLLLMLFVPILTLAQTTINSLSDITDPNGSYILSSGFSTTGTAIDANDDQEIGTSSKPFTGIIDGGLITITGTWDKPLFDYIQDATIKNVIIENTSVTASGNAGAIASNAKGESRIYNCGILDGTVSGSAYVGGIVGQLHNTGTAKKGSRVINCFSYANVGGGTVVAGIVGFNGFASTKADIRTLVMNCMFYGDVTSGDSKSPVYGGNKVNNAQGLNNYNYYRYESNFSKNNQIDIYNCALAVEDKYLYHFEYYRLLLNSNKKLAAYYITGNKDDAAILAKWVLETADRTIDNPYPYPILKSQGRYPSIINFDDAHAPTLTLDSKGKPVESQRNKGGKFGNLTVYIQDHTSGNGSREGMFITTGSTSLPITDKDFDRYNYNYYKVRLPYYNDVGSGNYTGGKVVTGWIITGMTGATPTQATSGSDVTITDGVVTATPYNFADRTCTKFADGSYRVFSQGAYFDVPAGVTAITIQPYWANAAFLADSYLDVSYKSDYSGATNLTIQQYTNNNTYTIDGFSGLTVYTSFSNAVGGISTKGSTVYDNAVVLVGNFHQVGVPYNVKETPITIMSADFDNDHEPDYSFIYNHTDRKEVSPIRFDFINVPGTAMAQKPNSSTKMCNVGIFKPYGWFELTNTALMRFGQFEHSFDQKADAPVIFLGGEVEQIVSNNSGNGYNYTSHTSYFLIGGNAWFKEFNNGTHSDKTHPTPHTPVSVSGGRFEKFYLSGIYQPNVNATTDNAECYISGGSFGEVAGAGQEQIKGNVNWIIDYADIDNFYGGGINAAKPVTGNIDIVIRNSWVDVYCGGPKFGDMGDDKTVKTQATDCVFRRFFGAGYGGNSYNRVIEKTQENSQPWNEWQASYTGNRGKYISNKNGIPTSFEYEYFIGSKGTIWGRFYVNYASFSKATVHNVTSQLTGCYISGDFYGGGSLGVVDGTATSVLDGCTVDGSVFGGGYSATIPNIDITSEGFTTYPTYNSEAGLFTPAEFSASDPYTWETHAVTNNASALGNDVIYTTSNLTNLGEVANVVLTITGNTYVKGDIHTYDEKGVIDDLQTATGGGVFGGGDASAIGSNTIIVIDNVSAQNQQNILNVFGGGNQAGVAGSTNVTLTSGSVTGGVYGGCNAEGSVGPVTISLNGGTAGSVYGGGFGSATTTTSDIGVTLNGTTVNGDIYGGSALGSVNSATASPLNATTINLQSATLHGRVFGGGMGNENTTATSNGNAIVNINTASNYLTGIYGGANINGLVKGNIDVNVNANVGATGAGNALDIFGGGYGANTNTEGNVTVTIGSLDGTYAPTIYGDIYGGSALGNVNDAAADLTKVDFLNGTLHGNIYGGGLGQRSPTPIAAKVNGQVQVNIGASGQNNCAIDLSDASVFGCNNTNGSPQDNVTVNIYCTAHNAQYGIDQVFGGGNQADYAPENGLETSAKRATVNVIGCLNTIRRVFGGGNAAAALGVVTVIDGGTFNQVFGGGNGESSAANIGAGGTNLTVHGGIIDQLFGGSNTSGTIFGPMNTLVDGTGDCAASMNIAEFFCGNNLANIGTQQNPTSIIATIGCGTTFGDVYGGCSLADIYGDITLNIEGGTINRVFGGSKGDLSSLGTGHVDKAANISGNVTLNITGGSIGSAFGGSNIYGNITGSIQVNVEKGVNPCTWSIGNIYGASNDAAYTPTAQGNSLTVNIKNGNINGSVYGGGKGATATVTANPIVTIGDNNADHFVTLTGNVYGGGDAAAVVGNTTVIYNDNNAGSTVPVLFGGGNAAGVSGTSAVTLTLGKVTQGIYGGCNASGSVGAAVVSLIGGTVGSANARADVFGGGYGASTTTTGNVTVNVGNLTGSSNPVIYGDIYGGSALGSVNDEGSDLTSVNIYSGNINGDIYGGGLGQAGQENVAKGQVNGAITVNIGATDGAQAPTYSGYATISGSIYGCNNTNGSPKDNVTVNIYHTAHTTTDVAAYTEDDGEHGTPTYALDQVFGGGNQADYSPAEGKKATVHIYSCDNTIRRVFGGGNAAAALGVATIIDGGRISNVFGGGNGEVSAANIGTGGTDLQVHGGDIAQLFGGSNKNGSIQGNMGISIDNDGDCGQDMFIAEFFCGNNEADVATDINATIGCGTRFGDVYGGCNLADITGNVTLTIEGGVMNNVYGGSKGRLADQANSIEAKAADISGNVTLNIYGGKILENAFGGSNINGNIDGAITVNLDWSHASNDCNTSNDLYVGNIYGASNLATYTPSTVGNYPAVYIKNGTVSGNVYGGGKGTSAVVTSNPNVTVGDATAAFVAVVTGDVYGGGDAAAVIGTTFVRVINNSNTTIGNVYGGGNAADVSATSVTIDGGTIIGDVYGGGHGDKESLGTGHSDKVANVNGNVSVAVTGGTINRVFGGANTNGSITGASAINVSKGNNSGNLNITELYGGGNMAAGNAGTITIGCTGGSNEGIGDVYGGANQANIGNNINLNITGGSIQRVFGGNNTSGTINGTIAVTVNWDTQDPCGYNYLGSVIGGGNRADYAGTPTVTITNGTVHNVYGGGNQANVAGTLVNMNGGAVLEGIYGGCNTSGTVTGNVAVNINGGTIGTNASNANIHGGGFGQSTGTSGNVEVTVGSAVGAQTYPTIYGDVYGGSALGKVNGTTLNNNLHTYVTLNAGIINGSLYGGALGDPDIQANVYAPVTVNVNGGTVTGGVYGCNNVNGSPQGAVAVHINGTDQPANSYAIAHVFGGGNQAAYNGTPTVTIHHTLTGNQIPNPNSVGYIYGGGNEATVTGTDVTVYGGSNIGYVFGGGYGANVTQNGTSVKIYGGIINQVFGGNDQSGSVTGAISVTVDKQTETGHEACLMQINEVYGGGNLAASQAGALTIGATGGDTEGIGYVFGGANDADVTGNVTLNITGGRITNLFGGNNTGHTVSGNITVNVNWNDANGPNDSKYLANVYGGGQLADVSGSIVVNITKGIISGDVYGGGALANTNTGNLNDDQTITTNRYTTEVNLRPDAIIYGDVYGGGRGQKETSTIQGVEAIVYGNVTVYQLGAILVPAYSNGLATSGRIFGCNNANGTPKGHVLVYVNKTTPANVNDKYALAAVYGGGNEAAYIPYKIAQDDSENTEVVIDGCTDVTIHSVYGGGNAASTPATNVRILGAKEIEYVYGGGNGAGQIDGHDNPGANVGYKAYPESVAGPDQIAQREQYKYGSGVAKTEVSGGKINYLYGGSNTKGNVRMTTIAQLEELGSCPLVIGQIYGGGREAYMEGNARIDLGCMTGMEEIYGGSEKADVGNSIELTITSGTFTNVYGGNNKGGRILGSITVNIEQTGCLPINIENLYLGGNNAPYSVYGYEETTYDVDMDGETITHYDLKEGGTRLYNNPVLNIRSFQSIGTVYGGGNGIHATMVADPTVDINVTHGWVNGEYTGESTYAGSPQMLPSDGVIGTVYGGGNEAVVIGNTYLRIGDKLGSPVLLKSMDKLKDELEAATDNTITDHGIIMTKTSNGVRYTNETNATKTLTVTNSQTVMGATITGNVYGGGNNADVTGNTDIQLGPNP